MVTTAKWTVQEQLVQSAIPNPWSVSPSASDWKANQVSVSNSEDLFTPEHTSLHTNIGIYMKNNLFQITLQHM